MPAHVRVGGTWRQALSLHVRVGGTWRAVQTGWVRVAGVWQRFYDAATASASPTTVSWTGFGAGGVTGVTGSTTVTGLPGGGTFSWAYLSGDTGATIDSPTSASTTFRRTVTAGQSFTTVFRCTYSAPGGGTATADVTATWTTLD